MNLNPIDIFNDVEVGKIDKHTAIKQLILLFENEEDYHIRKRILLILARFKNKDDDIFQFFENLLISDLDINVRCIAACYLIINFPDKCVEPIQWVLKDISSSQLFNIIFDHIWWANNDDWAELKKILFENIKNTIQLYVNEGVNREDAIVLALFHPVVYEKLYRAEIDDSGRLRHDMGETQHYRTNENGNILGLYFAPHSDDVLMRYLPESISHLEYLEDLHMLSYALEAIPESLGNLKYLKKLNLSFNYIENIPESIGNLKNLEELMLGHNNISEIPESICLLENLKIMELYENNIEIIPDSIGELKSLEVLYLSSNKIKKLPDSIGKLISLKNLNIYKSDISEFPEAMSCLVNLENLGLGCANISIIPDWIGNIKSLKILGLSENNISIIPKSISNLSSLNSLYLDSNKITEIPDYLFELISLGSLSLNNNRIKEIPESIGKLVSLGFLSMNHNIIKKVPDSIGNLSKLGHLSLKDNFIDEIPKTLINLKKLSVLELSNNTIAECPEFLADTNIHHIELNNNLVEEIPNSLSERFDTHSMGRKPHILLVDTYLDGPFNSHIAYLKEVVGNLIGIKHKEFGFFELSSIFSKSWVRLCDENNIKSNDYEKEKALKFTAKHHLKSKLSLDEAIGIEFLKFITRKAKSSLRYGILYNKIVRIETLYSTITKFSVFEFFQDLLSLRIHSDSLKDLIIPESFKNLIYLDISGNNILNIEGIQYLTNLKSLNIRGTQLNEIKLESLYNLEYLELTNNKLKKVESLSKLTNLKNVNLYNNPISYVDDVENLTNLEVFNVLQTNLPEIQINKIKRIIERNSVNK